MSATSSATTCRLRASRPGGGVRLDDGIRRCRRLDEFVDLLGDRFLCDLLDLRKGHDLIRDQGFGLGLRLRELLARCEELLVGHSRGRGLERLLGFGLCLREVGDVVGLDVRDRSSAMSTDSTSSATALGAISAVATSATSSDRSASATASAAASSSTSAATAASAASSATATATTSSMTSVSAAARADSCCATWARTWAKAAARVLSMPPSGSWTAWERHRHARCAVAARAAPRPGGGAPPRPASG